MPPVKAENKVAHVMFTKVAAARQLLLDQADKIIAEYIDLARAAKDAGDYETSAKILQWLIEHMPADQGNRIVDVSVDKKVEQVQQGPTGPTIQIGINVGGVAVKKPKQLPPAEVIDAE